jgi:DNA mismatch endonuclease (patch repair protein)
MNRRPRRPEAATRATSKNHSRPHPRRKPEGEPPDPSGHGLVVDPETSARLSGVRQQGTTPEQVVRRTLHRFGLRFRVSNRDLEGSPDLANRGKRWAIFVHGCFWHQHTGCAKATVPKRNVGFWTAKFAANKARDARVRSQLEAKGYLVITIWQCEVEDPTLLLRRLRKLLGYSRENRVA